MPLEEWRNQVYHLHFITVRNENYARRKAIEFENEIKQENDNRFHKHQQKVHGVSPPKSKRVPKV